MMLTTATTLWWFDVKKPEGIYWVKGGQRDTGILQMRDAYISILEGPMIQFRKRKM